MNARTPADPLTPCTECGGPTYTFASGSIWCPNEECQPGGRFLVRVAFERSPSKTGVLPTLKGEKRERRAISAPTPITPRVHTVEKRVEKPADPFAVGMDTFIGKDAR